MIIFNFSTVSKIKKLVSVQHTHDINVSYPKTHGTMTLSLSSNGQFLLVGQDSIRKLHIYSASNGSHVITFGTPGEKSNNKLDDAVWLPHSENYIACTSSTANRIYLMSVMPVAVSDIMYIDMTGDWQFSVFQDNVIYATDKEVCVRESRDAVKWSPTVKVYFKGERCWHAVKVTVYNRSDNMWIIVARPDEKWILRTYEINNNSSGDYTGWRDVTVPAQVSLDRSKLAHDGVGNIFTTDRINAAVHVWSAGGRYVGRLLSPQQNIANPSSLIIDTQHHVMYVGQYNGMIGVFTLQYRE